MLNESLTPDQISTSHRLQTRPKPTNSSQTYKLGTYKLGTRGVTSNHSSFFES